MRSRILVGYLGLVVVVLAALEIPLGVQFGRNEQRTLETKVEHDATTIASIAPDTLRRRLRPLGGLTASRLCTFSVGRRVRNDRSSAMSRLVEGFRLPHAVAGHPALELCNTRAIWWTPAPIEYLHDYPSLVVLARELGS